MIDMSEQLVFQCLSDSVLDQVYVQSAGFSVGGYYEKEQKVGNRKT